MASDPNYNPGFWGWIWDGVTHPNQALNTFENNTLTPAANAIGDFLSPVTTPLNNLINNGGVAGQALGSVLQTGGGVSSDNGFHAGMTNPNPGPSQAGWDKTEGNTNAAITGEQNRQASASSPFPVNPSGTFNGQGPSNLGTRSPFDPKPAFYPTPDGKAINPAGNTPTPTSGGAPAAPAQSVEDKAAALRAQGMDANVAAAVAAGALGSVGSIVAGNTQAQAAQDSAKLQSDQFNAWLDFQKQQAEQQQKNIAPWLQAGGTALGQLSDLTSDAKWHSFGMSDFQQDPGYQFRLDQGMKALQNSAAARGGLLSGNTMKGITDYSQGAASQEYNNAFNRYQTERNARLNSLQSLAGLGQTAVGQANQASQTATNNTGEAMMGSANALANGMNNAATARASGYMGAGNALTNALSTGLNQYNSNKWLNALTGG